MADAIVSAGRGSHSQWLCMPGMENGMNCCVTNASTDGIVDGEGIACMEKGACQLTHSTPCKLTSSHLSHMLFNDFRDTAGGFAGERYGNDSSKKELFDQKILSRLSLSTI